MKRIIMFVLLFAALKVAGQTTGYLRFDTVKIMKQNGTCELYIINKTKDSLGLLTNVGGGLTRFIKPKVLNDSTVIIGLDTLVIKGGSNSPPLALTNVGAGYRRVTTPNGSIKTEFAGYGILKDSTTNANAITDAVDTTSTNHVVTQSDLNDAIAGGSIETIHVAYVDSAFGDDGTAVVNRPDKPFLTINAALDATASLHKRIIEIGVGTFASPDSAKIKSYTWFRGSGKPKPNWTVAVPSVDADTKTAPTALIGGTILQGSFWFNSYRLQNIIISDLGVDVGSAWCTANNSGNPAEGLLFATAYTPGSGTAADGGHFLQSGTTPLQGLVVRNVAALCQSASAAVHAALFENCFAPDISGVSTYFGTHGIVFKCIGGTANNLQAFGHTSNGIIIKSNDYANCYRLSISNFNIGSIESFDGGGLILDANDAGSPGLYFCNISSGTINRTTYGIRTQGSVIDGNNISNIEVNVAQGNGVDILSGFAYGSLQNIKARTCGGIGFNIASTQSGITINDCDAHDNTSDGFRFTSSVNANFDNINAILNDGYGVNVVSGSVHGGIRYFESNGSGTVNGTVISKISAQSLAQVTAVGATTADAISITGYSTTGNKFRVGDFAWQPYSLNNGIFTDNADFNGSAWTRFNTGYASKLHFFNGQVMLSAANTGSGAPTWVQGFKTDFNGHVGLGGNIDDVTFSGSKVYIDGSSGRMGIGTTSPNYLLDVNGKAAIRTIDSVNTPINMLYQDPATGEIFKAAVPSGTSYSFTNGLTETGGTAKLGGTLTENTQISTDGFTTVWTGTNDGETLFSVTNTGTTGANAFAGNAGTGTGITGTSTSGIGVIGSSSSNYGLLGTSTSGQAIRGQINPASTNTIANAMSLLVTTSGGAGANGLGAAIQFELETATSGNSQSAGSVAFKWTDATNGTQTSQYEINGVNSGTTARKAALAGNGQWTWDGYGSGTHTGTPTGSLQTTSAGAIIEGPVLAAGTFTPSLTAVTNTSSPLLDGARYTRVGNIVTFSLRFSVTTSSGSSASSIRVTLPVNSSFSNVNQAAGTCSGSLGYVESDATNDELIVAWVSGVSGSETIVVTGQYTIL